jgi:ribosomal subunit interface protein
MQYQISGIHIDVGDALQTHVKGELSDTISKYAERPTDAQIIFSKSGHEFVCDAIIHLSTGLTAQAKASKAEIYAAFDACAEKMEKQLRRYKRKLKGHHKDRNQSVEFIDPASYTDPTKEGQKDSATDSEPMIVAETERTFPVFSVKAASEELEKSNLPFLLFKTKEKQGVHILFQRDDGNIGWVQPN